MKNKWEETKHLRDKDGKFTDAPEVDDDSFERLMARVEAALAAKQPKTTFGDRPDWTLDEEEEIRQYQMSGLINAKLQSGAPLDPTDQKHVEVLDAAMHRFPITEDTHVVRYMSSDVLQGLQSGDRIEHGDAKLSFMIPAYTPTIDFRDNKAGVELADEDSQHEIALPRGAVFDIDRIEGKTYHVKLMGFTQDD